MWILGSLTFKMGGEWICANCRVELQLRGMSETPVINRDDLYKLSTLDLSAITFEGIIAWSDSKVARHSDNFLKIIRQLLSDDILVLVSQLAPRQRLRRNSPR